MVLDLFNSTYHAYLLACRFAVFTEGWFRVSDNLIHYPGGHAGPWLFAHRGTSTLAPENTAAAFDMACSVEADALEIDVRISHDRQVIVTHDPSLVRTTNAEGLVAKHSLAALRQFDAGYHYLDENGQTPWRGKGLTLLTLSELFTQFPGVGINLDIKDAGIESATIVAAELRRIQDGRWINVCSFNSRTIGHFRQIAPEFSTAASQLDVARLFFGRWMPSRLRKSMTDRAQGQVLQLPRRWSGLNLGSASFIEQVQYCERLIMFWTINDEHHMRALLDSGANALVSDNIFVARKIINQHMATKTKSV